MIGGAPITASDPVENPMACRAEAALATRLRTAADLLGTVLDDPVGDPAVDAAHALDLLARDIAASPEDDRIWLLLCALAAAYPGRDDVDRVRRAFRIRPIDAATIALLECAIELGERSGAPTATMDVVTGAVVVDVDHSARHDLHTGVQQVVRNLLPEWAAEHPVVLAAWNSETGALRSLSSVEQARVLRWNARPAAARQHSTTPDSEPDESFLVPWRSVVVLAEVPSSAACDRLCGLADDSGNSVVAIFYDAIPIVSADLVPNGESSKFVRYLTCLKFTRRVAAISWSATTEIEGFSRALRTQGLRGPVVSEVRLAEPPVEGVPANPADHLSILVVGSHEPRKNHLAVLHSAEILWREGLEFSLVFVGGSGWGDDFQRTAQLMQDRGRDVEVLRAISDAELQMRYASSTFTVFPSLHEGFGLPVAESLAHGTAVITSNYGSTAEIAQDGGALLIDPRDDGQLTVAMRTLLVDEDRRAVLEDQALARAGRGWNQYARDLWETIVEPELQSIGPS